MNIMNREEVCTALLQMVEENQPITWSNFIKKLENEILTNYDGLKIPSEYKGVWKNRFRACAKLLKIQIADSTYDHWDTLVTRLQEKRKSARITERSSDNSQNVPSSSLSTTSSKPNHKLSSVEKTHIIKLIESIKDEEKWKLKSGRFVEDQMLLLIKKSCYEHPVHSLIIDPSDKIWEDFFTTDELKEIRTTNCKSLPKLSQSIAEDLNRYTVEGLSAITMYQLADDTKAHPITETDKCWIKESMKSACSLFFKDDELVVQDFSERDLLHKLWDFTYKLQNLRSIKAKLGERVSIAVSLGRNGKRSLEVVDRRPRKAMGAKLDILFKSGIYELGSCEVGLHDVEKTDDKYINDSLMKLPKTLRDMLVMQVRSNPSYINSLTTVGYLMMGLQMELVTLDIPKGNHVARVTKTERFPFPCTAEGLNTDFVSLLELTWRGSQMMEKNLSILKMRKRKEIELVIDDDKDATLIPSFSQHQL